MATPSAYSSKSSENHFWQALPTYSNPKPISTSFLSLSHIGMETTPSDRRGRCGEVVAAAVRSARSWVVMGF